jgi:AraC-like DNA-binding protein
VRRLEAREVLELDAADPYWNNRYTQLTPGPLHASWQALQSPGIHLSLDDWNQGLMIRADPPSGSFVVAAPRDERTRLFSRNRLVERHQAIALMSEAEVDVRTAGPAQLVVCVLPSEHILSDAEALGVDASARTDTEGIVEFANARARDEIAGTLRALAVDLLARHEVGPLPAARILAAASLCSDSLLRASPRFEDRMSPAARVTAAARARDFIDAHPSEVTSIADLCRITGTRERSLYMGFLELTGLSPTVYLRVRRLHCVRAELSREGNPPSVTEAATRHGFWHLGRFADHYRKLFGELPSQTLRRARGLSQRAWQRPDLRCRS